MRNLLQRTLERFGFTVTVACDGIDALVQCRQRDGSSAAGDFSDDIMEALQPLDDEFFTYPHNLTELLFALCLEAS
jgi:hypothetical protein